MRSWSKWVIFSRRMKSSIAVGPRRPIFSECWLSATGTPWLVVRWRSAGSTRTRSSGPRSGSRPCGGLPLPTLSELAISLLVLPVAAGVDGWRCSPTFGVRAASPYSDGLFWLNGMLAASFFSAAALSNRRSSTGLAADTVGGVGSDGPAMVLSTEPAPSALPFAGVLLEVILSSLVGQLVFAG
jgi:hypothetical protein